MTTRNVLGLLLVAVLGVACGRPPAEAEVEPPAVRVAPVTQGSIREWLRFSGRVVPPPDRDATLSPRVAGVLAEVSARLGERVARGRVLARVEQAALAEDLTAADAAEKSAAADAVTKRRMATRTRTLESRGVVSGEQAEVDEAAALAAEAALFQAQAARAESSRRHRWAEIVAPFDGVVVRVLRQAGEPVDGTVATPVVEIAAEHPVEIALDATADALALLKVGQSAEIDVTGEAGAIPALVKGVAAAVDNVTGTGPVRLGPENDDSSLLIGRVVAARVAVAQHDGVIVVPATALRGGADGTLETVVVVDHKAHVRTVAAGIRDGDRVEILSGLAPGDSIVVDDPVGLADEAVVRDGP